MRLEMRREEILVISLVAALAATACQGDVALSEPFERPSTGPVEPSGPPPTDPERPVTLVEPVEPVGPDTEPEPPNTALQPLRRISSLQYRNVVRDLLGPQAWAAASPRDVFPETAVDKHVFINDADANTVNTAESESIEDNAELMAEALLADAQTLIPQVMPCAPSGFSDADIDGCIDDFLRDFGRRAHRRPLTEAERGLLRGVYDEVRAEQSATEAWATVVQYFLLSPALLYRPERGDAPLDAHPQLLRVTGYEMATRLSFFLLNSAPDPALLDAAEAGELQTPDQVRAQAERLLDAYPDRVAAVLGEFHRDWLYTRGVAAQMREHPAFTPAARAALDREVQDFVSYVFDSPDPTYRHLMTAESFPVDAALGPIYGVDGADGAVVQVPHRKGLLTLASFAVAHARARDTSTILRGHFLLTDVLCGSVPLPGVNVDIQGPLENTAGEPTARLRQAPLLNRPDCAGCHVSFSPLGLALENFDDVGIWRERENGVAIDASGTLMQGDAQGSFADAFELVELIAHSERGQSCYAQQWFRYAMGRLETRDDVSSLRHLVSAFVADGGDLRTLLVEMTQTPAFLYRRVGQK
jgi:hypothetical protein